MKQKLSIEDLDLKGKRVFIRVDFNVPLGPDRTIQDDTRIKASLPTIRYAIEKGAKGIILASHLGRPKGKRDEGASMKPVAERLEELLKRPVAMASDCIGPEVAKMVQSLKNGEVLMLENLRFHEGETKNDPEFAKKLAELADLYVDDAFGAAHRAHASVSGMANYFAQRACGFLMKKEIEYLGRILTNPEKPFIAIMGGAKVSDKLEVLENLLGKVNAILVGGGMAYTFLRATGLEVGTSLVEEEKIGFAGDILAKASGMGVEILLPKDCVVSTAIEDEASAKTVNVDAIPKDRMGLDIGPETIALFKSAIKDSKTVFWNGPMGVFEKKAFSSGTMAVAVAISQTKCLSVVGGGDSVAALHEAGVEGKITHVSTGGGASLEFLSGLGLPGLDALTDK